MRSWPKIPFQECLACVFSQLNDRLLRLETMSDDLLHPPETLLYWLFCTITARTDGETNEKGYVGYHPFFPAAAAR